MTDRKEITAADFELARGYSPEDDDLERCNCPKAGEIGHRFCGWNYDVGQPIFVLGEGLPECGQVWSGRRRAPRAEDMPVGTVFHESADGTVEKILAMPGVLPRTLHISEGRTSFWPPSSPPLDT